MIKNDRQQTKRRYPFIRGLMALGLVLGMSAFYSTANATAVALDGQHSDGGNIAQKNRSSGNLDSDNLKLGFFDEEVLYLEFADPGNNNNVNFDFDIFNVAISDPGITKIGFRFENINPSTAPTEGIIGTFASFLEPRITFEGYPFVDTPSASEMNTDIGGDYIELWYTIANGNGDGHLGGFTMNLEFDWDGLELANPNQGFNINIGINNPSLDLSTSFVPVPAAIWLLGTALVGLFFNRRKI